MVCPPNSEADNPCISVGRWRSFTVASLHAERQDQDEGDDELGANGKQRAPAALPQFPHARVMALSQAARSEELVRYPRTTAAGRAW